MRFRVAMSHTCAASAGAARFRIPAASELPVPTAIRFPSALNAIALTMSPCGKRACSRPSGSDTSRTKRSRLPVASSPASGLKRSAVTSPSWGMRASTRCWARLHSTASRSTSSAARSSAGETMAADTLSPVFWDDNSCAVSRFHRPIAPWRPMLTPRFPSVEVSKAMTSGWDRITGRRGNRDSAVRSDRSASTADSPRCSRRRAASTASSTLRGRLAARASLTASLSATRRRATAISRARSASRRLRSAIQAVARLIAVSSASAMPAERQNHRVRRNCRRSSLSRSRGSARCKAAATGRTSARKRGRLARLGSSAAAQRRSQWSGSSANTPRSAGGSAVVRVQSKSWWLCW